VSEKRNETGTAEELEQLLHRVDELFEYQDAAGAILNAAPKRRARLAGWCACVAGSLALALEGHFRHEGFERPEERVTE